MSIEEIRKEIEKVERKMKKAAAELNFELAVELRDRMMQLKKELFNAEK